MKTQLIIFSIVLAAATAFSQSSETWLWQDYCVGQDATGAGNDTTEAAMPDVRYFNGKYYMYYNSRYDNRGAIKYATSLDAINWTVQDTILTGSSDSLNREYEIGGARVVQIGANQYRLFYRCAPKSSSGNPAYHIRSAFSTNGEDFTKEGVRIEIVPNLANSYFTQVAHSAFYYDTTGTVMRAMLTSRDTSLTAGPPGIYTGTSYDDGLTWSNFLPLYPQAHDPVVFFDNLTSEYKMYFAVLSKFFKTSSIDGINWPASYDSLFLLKNTDTLWVASPDFVIGDMGGFQLNTGQTLLYSNFKPDTVIPWSNIAYYIEQNTSHINNENPPIASITIYPNPVSDGDITLHFGDLNVKKIHVLNLYGQQIYTQQLLANVESINLSLNNFPNGILLIKLETTDGLITRKVIKQ